MGNGAGAFGPYRRETGAGTRWVVVVRAVPGSDGTSRSFDEEGDAVRFRDDHRAAIEKSRASARSIGDAIDAYDRHLAAEGYKQRTETIRRCRSFFEGDLKRNLRTLTAPGLVATYDAITKRKAVRWEGSGAGRKLVKLDRPISATTHRGMLTHTKTFLAWCVEKRWLPSSPLATVKPKGKLAHGKPQLRIDEARKWNDAAMKLAPTTPGAVAALCALVLGMRATEITSRLARDLDDDGRLLWIPHSKTPAGRRTLEVPATLRPVLLALAAVPVRIGRGRKDKSTRPRIATDLLFGTDRRGRPHGRGWPLMWVKVICEAAGVLTVSAHSMRGLHSTLAIQAGATSHLVAGALGQASDAVTIGSYIAPGANEDAKLKRGLRVLDGGKRGR